MCNFLSVSDHQSDYLLALVQLAGELYGHAEPAELHWGAVLFAGQEDTVRLDVSVDDVVVVTILQGLKHQRLLLAEC